MNQKLYNLFNKRETLKPSEIFIVAEIGKNFIQSESEQTIEEYMNNAKKLIDAAAEAGADAVKFQTHEVEDEQANIKIVSPHFKSLDRYKWVKRNTLATPLTFWQEIKSYSENKGLIFFSTPMSRGAAIKLDEVGVPLWKIGSGDVDDFLLLDYVLSTNKPVIISSGMVSLDELDKIMSHLKKTNLAVGLLYCVSEYPCPLEHFNLSTIELFTKKYPWAMIGFSDHSIDGHDVTLAAVKLGARMIEKHFSLSRDFWGSDHKVSLLPNEFKDMVMAIRAGRYDNTDVKVYYGSLHKELEGATNKFRPYFKKTLTSSVDIPAGKIIDIYDLCALRPQKFLDGISPDLYSSVIGKKARVNIKKHTPITDSLLI
jgi:sialic acid synthase SpsE